MHKTLKEVVVLKDPNVVHIYNVIEHGRRWYRSLIFTSDTRYCLHEMTPSIPHRVSSRDQLKYSVSGDGAIETSFQPSVVITRNLQTTSQGTQTFIPERFLRGMVPSSLLMRYQFWQNPDDSITGYARPDADDHAKAFELNVELVDNACTSYRVVDRSRIHTKTHGQVDRMHPSSVPFCLRNISSHAHSFFSFLLGARTRSPPKMSIACGMYSP